MLKVWAWPLVNSTATITPTEAMTTNTATATAARPVSTRLDRIHAAMKQNSAAKSVSASRGFVNGGSLHQLQ